MRIIVNDKEVNFPSSLSEITLGQRIAFHNEHGRELDQMLESIIKMPEGLERELEETQFVIEKEYRTFAFFADCTVEAIKESKFIDQVASVYHSCMAVLFAEEDNMELKTQFAFKDELWEMAPPVLEQKSNMTFGEFIDAKQMTKDLHDLGAGRWEIMLKLCAIFLRKKGEEYKEEFSYEGSDRQELMKDLTMDIAMRVGFFLSASTNFSINILKYSGNQKSKVAAVRSKIISSATAG